MKILLEKITESKTYSNMQVKIGEVIAQYAPCKRTIILHNRYKNVEFPFYTTFYIRAFYVNELNGYANLPNYTTARIKYLTNSVENFQAITAIQNDLSVYPKISQSYNFLVGACMEENSKLIQPIQLPHVGPSNMIICQKYEAVHPTMKEYTTSFLEHFWSSNFHNFMNDNLSFVTDKYHSGIDIKVNSMKYKIKNFFYKPSI